MSGVVTFRYCKKEVSRNGDNLTTTLGSDGKIVSRVK